MTRRDQIIRLAEQVMGWHEEKRGTFTDGYPTGYLTTRYGIERWDIQQNRTMVPLVPFDPYASLTDAWMLVEALADKYHAMLTLKRYPDGLAFAAFELRLEEAYHTAESSPHATEEAICAAALRFVELMEESKCK